MNPMPNLYQINNRNFLYKGMKWFSGKSIISNHKSQVNIKLNVNYVKGDFALEFPSKNIEEF